MRPLVPLPSLALLALPLLAAACGGGSGAEPTEAALRAAATRNAEAFLDQDWRTAYDGFTPECREEISYSDFVAEMSLAIGFFEAFLGTKWDDLDLGDVVIEEFNDDEALVRVRMSGPDDVDFTDETEEPSRWVFEDGKWYSADCNSISGDDDDFFDDDPDSTAPTEPATGPGSSRAEPAPIGTTVTTEGWDIRVLSVEPDGADIVLEDSFNDPPAAGNQFFLVEVEATYNGDEESSTFFFDVTLKALGPSNVAYDFDDGCGFFDGELDDSSDVFQGGTIRGYVCWEVSANDAAELLMFAEPGFREQSGRRWWSLAE